MNNSHLGFEKPVLEKPCVGTQVLPLAPSLPTLQQGAPSMTRLANSSQGGRLQARSSPTSILSDSPMMTNLQPPSQGNPQPSLSLSLSSSSTRKRKLPLDEYNSFKKRIKDLNDNKNKRFQNKFAERCALLCFLQAKGHLSDFSPWRSRLPIVPLQTFLKTNKLDTGNDGEDLYKVLQSQNHSLLQSALTGNRQGSNTDVRVPSTPPAIKSELSSKIQKLTPVKSAVKNASPVDGVNSQEQIVERAKQEAYVMQRVGELQKDGLWPEKRLPKVHELPRAKAHWDYLLEEMAWLAADFAQERKWKKAAAKKCARMVQKHFQEKEALVQKAIKAQEMQLKRIASFIAKEIKQFWSNVEKLVEFKQQTRLEEKRKKALDQHLSFIVDQTEKYSSLVAESMNTSRPSSPRHHSDDEFEPEDPSDDDEETIAKEEALSANDDKGDNQDEVDVLKRESELPLEDLLSNYLAQRDSISTPLSMEEDGEDDDMEYQDSGDSSDDEETILEQEKTEGTVDYKQEIDDLKEEGNMSIEQLKAKYGIQLPSEPLPTNGDSLSQRARKRKEIVDEESDEASEEDSEDEVSEEDESSSGSDKEDSPLKALINDSHQVEEGSQDKDKEINDVAAIAESLQPKGNTLSSTSVVTKVPFLLKHPLREYQHIGLDWLVTMYDRKLNGILADEMGLGKTIQTIALIAHLACEKGNWGPHLIIVPTSVMLNWEMEFKKWCPAFKILTYYGTQKERKLKRSGWTKPNAFHICITSYKLVIQDHQSFRRKKWKYLILDEAQNIKNFKSQRWQLLLNFQTQRRLLLTGTPLQNNLMELWSLMHFLMPNVFESHREFKEWFSNPVTGMIEGNSEYNDTIIKRLHKVLRPFLLRRLKCEVETQMPKKYEHIVMCRLSNRQRYLYDDFMSRAKTKETLASGSLLSVINVLMQLRKVCNHPNLFEVRPTVSPFQMDSLEYHVPSLVWSALDYDPFKHVDLVFLNLRIIEFELWLLAFVAHRARKYKVNPDYISSIDSASPDPPPCPKGRVKINIKKRVLPQPPQVSSPVRPIVQVSNNHRITSFSTKVGTSPLIKLGQNASQGVTLRLANPTSGQMPNYLQLLQPGGMKAISVASLTTTSGGVVKNEGNTSRLVPQFAQLVNTPTGRQLVLSPQPVIAPQGSATTVMTTTGQRLTVVSKQGSNVAKLVNPTSVTQINSNRPIMRVPPLNITSAATVVQNSLTTVNNSPISISEPTQGNGSTANSLPSPKKVTRQSSLNTSKNKEEPNPYEDLKDEYLENLRKRRRKDKLELIARINEVRCQALPIYGSDLLSSLTLDDVPDDNKDCIGIVHCRNALSPNPLLFWNQTHALSAAIHSIQDRVAELSDIFSRFVLYVPAVSSQPVRLHVPHPPPSKMFKEEKRLSLVETWLRPKLRLLHSISSAMSTQFPDRRLIQYDCGKLQSLDKLLRRLKADHHRILIFTQMTRMLDVLEAFLNFHGHIYLRLDGTTKVDQRQLLMERFNADKRIFCFILSTRSGGVGINLTGADTVIFYDSDWNPTMDAQAQDRCHRIGQTRDVHIYRLISEKTVEENILKKANQKRMLGDVAIEGGNFTTAYFKSSTIQDLFNVDTSENDASRRMAEVLHSNDKTAQNAEETQIVANSDEKVAIGALESAMAQAEDESDVAAAKVAKAEAAAELAEFDENIPIDTHDGTAGQEMSKAELELHNLMQQLTAVERYAMKFMEENDAAWSKEQLAAAEAEIEQQKKEWEAGRLAALQDRKSPSGEAEPESVLTYSGVDSRNQLWISDDGTDIMPMWCPPTPPQDDGDVYIDQALCLLYEPEVIPDSQLPPVYIKKEKKRSRFEAGLPEGRSQTKIRQREDSSSLLHAPRSLFDRPTPALIKMRQELKLQRYRGHMRPTIQGSIASKPSVPLKPLPEPEHVPDWLVQEDWMILQAIQHYQELTVNLVVISPGHTPNWDFVADVVNVTSRSYRSPKQCRNRYESVIMPREEGKLVLDSPKKQKKSKQMYKLPQMKSGRPLRTSQIFQQDNNSSLSQVMNSRFDAIRSVSNRRAPTVKPLLVDPAMKNPKHAEVLADCSIDYDSPLTPTEVAAKRADRIAKEKQAALTQQELGVTRTVGSSSTTQGISNAVQRSTSSNLVTVQSSTPTPGTPAAKGTKTLSAAQLQIYRQQQAVLRQQQQQQLRVLQSRSGATATAAQKVSVAVTSSTPTQRVQQVKGVTRAVSDTEMVALLKRQQAAKSSSQGTLTSAQILAQAGIHAQQTSASGQQVGQVATLVKTVPATSLPVTGLTLPQMKAALGSGLKANAVSSQQIRQLSIQQQLIAQHRKIPQQRVAQIGQVATKGGATAQLIVQSQKSMPTTVTMQQIQQVMKQVQPQHVVSVVAGNSSNANRGVTTLEATSRAGTQLTSTIKPTTSQQQQAILTQVSAVLQGGGAVRQPVRIQTSATPIVAVAVSQAPTVLTLPPQHDANQPQ
ncbi:helicase domino isoform X2 [Halyomorpha halys]|uniref:helicase domino isoform X2 n=1 Tax=Halyomorpha halys TaxID=286706 RepID=UPI0006D4F661|nr:helicase domino isoform X2 [Halyomorpha halys]